MKKTTIISLVIFFPFCVIQLNAQNQSTDINSSQTKKNTTWVQASQSTKEGKPYITPPIDENDPYMGRTEEFLHVMVVDKLPTDFPKYAKSYGLRYYNNLVNNYFEAHLDLLQEKYKQKILQSRNH